MLNVAGIIEGDFGNSDGISFTIFFQGCHFKCKGCHNEEMQSFQGGTEYTVEDVIERIEPYTDRYDYVTYLGGEPLDQDQDSLLVLMDRVLQLGLDNFLYTGYDLEDIPQEILDRVKYVKCGQFRADLPAGENGLASNNQAYYKVADGVAEKVEDGWLTNKEE